jgi:hypothetical protein
MLMLALCIIVLIVLCVYVWDGPTLGNNFIAAIEYTLELNGVLNVTGLL